MAKPKRYRPSQVRRMLADKNQRSKLPDRYLTPDLLARRRAAQATKADPLGASLRKESEAAARTEFDPQYEDISKAEKGSDQSRANLDAWFQQYLDQQKDVQARSAGAYTQAQGQVQGMDDEMAARDQKAAGALALGGKALGNTLGLPQGANVLGAGVAQKASLARQALNDSFAARLASESVTQGNYLRDREQIVGRQRVDELGKEQGRRTELGTQRSKLGTKRRDYLSKYMSEGRAAARKGQLEDAAFGLKQSDQAQDAKDKAAARSLTARGQDITTRGQDISSADRAADRAARGKGKGGKKGGKPTRGPGSITTGQENTYATNISNAVAQARRLKAAGADKDAIYATLRAGSPVQTVEQDGQKSKVPAIAKYDDYAINAAMDLVYRGGLSPSNVKRLHAMGVHIGGRYKRLSGKKTVTKKLPQGTIKF